jgi:hypothetical protein
MENKTKKSISINHYNSSILSNDGSYIRLSQNGVVKIGSGTNSEGEMINNSDPIMLKEYIGALRYNDDTERLEYCNGITWVEVAIEDDEINTPMVYSMLF